MNEMGTSEKIIKLLRRFHEKNNQPFDQIDSDVYFYGLINADPEDVLRGLMEIVKSEGFSKIPTVKQILEASGIKHVSDRDEAEEICGQIIFSISKFGSYQAVKAKEYLGEVAWMVVVRYGGWESLCSSKLEEKDFMRSSLRSICQSVRALQAAGRLNAPLEVPGQIKIDQKTGNICLPNFGELKTALNLKQ